MWSVSRSKIDKKLRGNFDVPLWGFVQKFAPVLCWNRITLPPASDGFYVDTGIARKNVHTRPPTNDIFERIHRWMNSGLFVQSSQAPVGLCGQCLNGGVLGQFVL